MVANMRPAPELRAPKVICHNPRGARGAQRSECGDLVAALWSFARRKTMKNHLISCKRNENSPDFLKKVAVFGTKYVIWEDSWFLGPRNYIWEGLGSGRIFGTGHGKVKLMKPARGHRTLLWEAKWQKRSEQPDACDAQTILSWSSSVRSILQFMAMFVRKMLMNCAILGGSSFKAVVNYQFAPYRCGPPGTQDGVV